MVNWTLESLGSHVLLHLIRPSMLKFVAFLPMANVLLRFASYCAFAIVRETAIDPEFEAAGLFGLVKSGDFVIEVGSNKGALTRRILKQVGAKGKVLSLEPNPFAFQFQILALGRRPNLVCLNLGLSNRRHNGVIEVGGLTDKAGSTVHSQRSSKLRVNCRFDTLDNLLENSSFLPSLIVIDSEGSELAVLQGAINTLTRLKGVVLLVEIHEHLVPDSTASILSFLGSRGFSGKPVHRQAGNDIYVFRQTSPRKADT